MKDSQTLVTAQGVGQSYQHREKAVSILRDINITIKQGETLAIVGPSGSGETTLLSILAGLILPKEGRVVANGVSLTEASEHERAHWRQSNVGFVFQSFELIPHFTALENVLLPLELMNEVDARVKAQRSLEQVHLWHRHDSLASTLSGGERQRVAIARAFVKQPTILFADEPTGNLDENNARAVMDLLWECHRVSGTTLVVVTHNQQLAGRCQCQYELNNGVLV